MIARVQAVTPLPRDFPHRHLLVAGGINTIGAVKDASKAQLVKLQDIGEAKADDIIKAAKAL